MNGWIIVAVILALIGGAVSMAGTVRHGSRDLPGRDRYKLVGIVFLLGAVGATALAATGD